MTDFSRMKVLVVASGTESDDGPRISCLAAGQVEALRQSGAEVHVGVVDNRTSLFGIMRIVRNLRRLVNQTKPDVVNAQYGSVVALAAALACGKTPLVVTFYGSDLLGTPNPGVAWLVRSWLGRRFGLFAGSRAAAVQVMSQNLMDALPALIRARATILPHGIDISFFAPKPKSECRSQLGWDDVDKIIIFNASTPGNESVKNPRLAREAVERVKARMPDTRLVMMSGVPRETVRLMMNAADCLICTSLHEGSPNIVKEAMACNLPVVSVACGDVPDRLQGVQPGGISPYDSAALADNILAVLRSDSRSNGRDALIRQKMTAHDCTERLLEMFRSAMEGRG